MKKNIWIWNHYATNMYRNQGGRHYWFAENLITRGYKPTVFCASTFHNSNDVIDTNDQLYTTKKNTGVPFVFVKTSRYSGNGRKRLGNMFSFYRNILRVAKEYAKDHGKPDVILASSVHPLTLLAGIKIAKKFNIPCICEVRDLWPESIVAYGALKRESLIAKLLYKGEKWIYKKADSVIMTWEGGKQYIQDQNWDRNIDLNKVHHISNGVVIESFDKNSEEYEINDTDLDNKDFKNIVYAGSIRKVNNLGMLIDAAKLIQNQGFKNIRFLIYGSGDESDMLIKRCSDENINNVIFKGRVEKKYVPNILKKAYINILHNSSTSLDKYGQSQNKLFEYLAAGRCIIQTYTTGYSVIDRYNCGVSVTEQNPEEIANVIIATCSNDDETEIKGQNARNASYQFDFNQLTEKLITILDSVGEGREISDEFIR